MKNEHEKEWQELFQKATFDIYDDNVFISMERAEKFIRANLSKIPEVRELIISLKELSGHRHGENCKINCDLHWIIADEALKKLEGK